MAAPLTRHDFLVSCQKHKRSSTRNEIFRVIAVVTNAEARLSAVCSVFQLVHSSTGCLLNAHDKQLPLWSLWLSLASEQMEVSCARSSRRANVLWNIEQVVDSRLPNGSLTCARPSFFEKFVEFHAVMFRGNKGLKPKEGEILSQPWQWPLNYKGQPFSGPEYRVYLLGNPVIWWSCLTMLIVFGSTSLCVAVMNKHHSASLSPVFERRLSVCRWLMLAWLIHYIPFWFMGRILYFHHYFPAQLFCVMLTAVFWDTAISFISFSIPSCWSWIVQHVLMGATLSCIVYSFYLFHCLSYGMVGPMSSESSNSSTHHLRWLESWDI